MNRLGGYSVLVHYAPAYGSGAEPMCYLARAEGDSEFLSLEGLSILAEPVVTHSFQFLVEWLRRKRLELPKQVVDIETGQRLIEGRQKSDADTPFSWSFEAMIGLEAAKQGALHTSSYSSFDGDAAANLVAAIYEKRWARLAQDLKQVGELERFNTVETLVYNGLLAVQYRGFSVDGERLAGLLDALEGAAVSAMHHLEIKERIDAERALRESQYLAEVAQVPLGDASSDQSAATMISEHKSTNSICRSLHEIIRSRRSRTILLRLRGPGDDNGHIVFDTVGTVTGRIAAVDPQLQRLRKDCRSALKAREDMALLYLDYSSFEPAIMAYFSQDERLNEAVRSEDFYKYVAHDLFGDRSLRKATKMIFLAYANGMTGSGLRKFIRGRTEREVLLPLEEMFPNLESWRVERQEDLRREGRIGTALGNYRYRESTGALTARERKWAVSQQVQGTGALVLKKLILHLQESEPNAHILLPMHDALLLEVPEAEKDRLESELKTRFEKVFEDVCPGVHCAVVSKSFASEMGSDRLVQGS